MPPKKAGPKKVGPSAAEIKEYNERNARLLVSKQLMPIASLGPRRKKYVEEHPEYAQQMAKQTRAMAKVLPREARGIARDLRESAINMNFMNRMVRQAPRAKRAPSTVANPRPSPVVAAAAAAHPIDAAALAAMEQFVEPDIAALHEAAEPGGKLRAEVAALRSQIFAKAKAGESAEDLNEFLFQKLEPKVTLYAAEYLGSGAASEMMDEIVDELQEIIRENAEKVASGGAGGPKKK
jgi:hypothetical protein